MIRWLEKKNWRKNIESCRDVANKVTQCVENSDTFKSFDDNLKKDFRYAVGKQYVGIYIAEWMHDKTSIGNPSSFYQTDSNVWEKNREGFEALNSECNFLSIQECCKEKYNLTNLEGDYENYAQTLKK